MSDISKQALVCSFQRIDMGTWKFQKLLFAIESDAVGI